MAVFTDMSSLHEDPLKTYMIIKEDWDAPGTLLKGTLAVLGKCPGTSPDTSPLCTEKAPTPSCPPARVKDLVNISSLTRP